MNKEPGADEMLVSAVRRNSYNMVRYWIDHGADVNYNNILNTSVIKASTKIITLLVENGAIVNDHIMSTVIEYKITDAMKIFARYGVHMNDEKYMIYALTRGAKNMIRVMIRAGIGAGSRSAIQLSIRKKYHDITRRLVAAGSWDDGLDPYEYISELTSDHVKYFDKDDDIVRVIKYRCRPRYWIGFNDVVIMTAK